MFRRWSSFCDPVPPVAHIVDEAEAPEPLGHAPTVAASRKPAFSRTSSEAGSGFTWRSRYASRNSTSSAGPGPAPASSLTKVTSWTSGNAAMSCVARVIVSAGVPRRTNATISTRSSRPRSAWRRLMATRPKSPRVKSEKAMVVTESADSSGARRNESSASRTSSLMRRLASASPASSSALSYTRPPSRSSIVR